MPISEKITIAVVLCILTILLILFIFNLRKKLRRLREYVIGHIYSDVKGDKQFGVIEIGLDSIIHKIDAFEFGNLNLQWLILSPGRHILSLSFEARSSKLVPPAFSTEETMWKSPHFEKELTVLNDSIQRLSGFVDGKLHSYKMGYDLLSTSTFSPVAVVLIQCLHA